MNEAPKEFLSILREQTGDSASASAEQLKTGVVAKIIPHSRDGEIAAAGAVRIPITVESFIQRFRDIAAFKHDQAVLNIQKFSDSPSPSDLDNLHLTSREQIMISRCRPGNCGMKMSTAMIRSLKGNNRPSLEVRFRAALWQYLSAYFQQGTSGMLVYNDKSNPASGSAEFGAILHAFGWLHTYAPPLYAALDAPFNRESNQTEEFAYWSREDLGLKPVISVTHAFVHRTMIGGRSWAFIASKQIYADHYMNASLGLTVLADGTTESGKPVLYVAYFNRTMTDGLRGWLAALQRSIVERRVRSALIANLQKMQRELTVPSGTDNPATRHR